MEYTYKSRSVIDTADAVRSGQLRAVDVLEQCLGTLEDLNPAINAFIMLRVGAAREEAQAIDRMVARGEDPGPLAGVPFGIKDIEDITGLPTTQGSLLRAGAPPAARDCPHVEKLRAAGAIAIGKTNMCEFGLDSGSEQQAVGRYTQPLESRSYAGRQQRRLVGGGRRRHRTPGYCNGCSRLDSLPRLIHRSGRVEAEPRPHRQE